MIAQRIVQLLDDRGELQRAERGGLEPEIVFKLAKRIKPDEALDFDRAVAELENATTIALDAIARAAATRTTSSTMFSRRSRNTLRRARQSVRSRRSTTH